jgi:NitT/TauT family transport system permease protein
MKQRPMLFGLHARPDGLFKFILGILPILMLISLYLVVSHIRLQENPVDKLTPPISTMVESTYRVAFVPDQRTGNYLMLQDTVASLKRILIGLGAAALVGLFIGVNMGLFPGFNAISEPVVKFLSIIPPLAILPVLFILFGVGELGKIMLIFIGSTFLITRDIYRATEEIPEEQIVKALTLGATQFQVAFRVVLPQIIPKLLSTVRICLGGAWLFLIAAEAIASTDGLGYRIFLVRRYLAMDIIIPYVLWITFLGFLMDTILRLTIKKCYPWYTSEKD